MIMSTTNGQDGLGQYKFYRLFKDGSTPSVPSSKPTIGSNGVLSPPGVWKSKFSTSVAGKTLWVLVGSGKPSTTVTWAGVYKAALKGDKGESGDPRVEYKKPDFTGSKQQTFDETGNEVHLLRFYGIVTAGNWVLTANADHRGGAHTNIKKFLVDFHGSLSLPSTGQQGQRVKRQSPPSTTTTDIPKVHPRIPHNKDYVLNSNESIVTIGEHDGGSSALINPYYNESPTIEGWGKHPALHSDSQAGEKVVVLEGKARIGDFITWTRFYLYDDREKYEKQITGTEQLFDGAVTTDKIADGAITSSKLDSGIAGQDGLGQYRYYALLPDGTTPPIPSRPTIGSDGILTPPGIWKIKFLTSEVGKTLWVLVGRGRPSGTVAWAGVYKVGDKGDPGLQGIQGIQGLQGLQGLQGDKGDAGSGGGSLSDGSVTTALLADSAVTKSKLASDVLTVARADTYKATYAWETNTNNTFLSAENGANTTRGSNTAIGCGALQNNTEGYYNTASGFAALKDNTTGNNNTAVGVRALTDNTSGNHNTAIGVRALTDNTSGNYNTAIGSHSLFVSQGCLYNTAIGINVFNKVTRGHYNTAIGNSAGGNLKTGDKNIFIGNAAVAPSVTSFNKLAIGSAITGDLAYGNITIKGDLTENSDERLKENVADVQDGLHCVTKLRPVKYTRKEIPDPVFEKDKDGNDIIPNPAPAGGQRGSSNVEYGLIAQEAEKVCPELIATSEYAEKYKSVNYSRLSIILLKAVQEQEEKIKAQQEQIEALKKRL